PTTLLHTLSLHDALPISRPLRSAMRVSSAHRSPPRALAPLRSPPPWRHSPMRRLALRSPPTIAPPLPGSPAESPPRAASNHSLHPPPEHLFATLESILPHVFLQPFLTSHRSRVNSSDWNAYSHHPCRQPSHRQLRTFLHRS